jgi:hypothetical protein
MLWTWLFTVSVAMLSLFPAAQAQAQENNIGALPAARLHNTFWLFR